MQINEIITGNYLTEKFESIFNFSLQFYFNTNYLPSKTINNYNMKKYINEFNLFKSF